MAAEKIDLPQDHMFYLQKSLAGQELVSPADQQRLDEKFNQSFFAPWHRGEGRPEKEEALARVKRYRENLGYGENRKEHTKEWIERLASNADLETFPNTGFRAITTANTNLRELPTHKPYFSIPSREGYPFDLLQYSAMAVNTPIFVSHLSQDKAWALAFSHYGTGWVPAADIASVGQDLVSTWENGALIAVVQDDVPIYDQEGMFRFPASLGWLFPKTGESGDRYEILIAVADENRKGVMKKATLAKKQAILKPLKLTSTNLARLANELLHKPYGWGGLYGNRDCSATLKDLFAPFGIWLPRDSKDQAAQETSVPLKNLSPKEKEKVILRDGIPFLTLIWMKGHIMLYIGNYRGKAVVFHNVWAVRPNDPRKGRKIIGQSVISTLYLGMEPAAGDRFDADLLNRVEGMTFLLPPK